MIELITARGNTSLESALFLTKEIRWDIQSLGTRIAKAAADEEQSSRTTPSTKRQTEREQELRMIVLDMKHLLERIEDAVPLMNLAITTSGVSLSTNLPASISPSRLLQASTFLSAGDAQYSIDPSLPSQVGPAFTLSLYMLFSGHAHDDDKMRNPVWKEVVHKARVKLVRVPLDRLHHFPTVNHDQSNVKNDSTLEGDKAEEQMRAAKVQVDEFAYQLSIIEDLDDGRVHTFDESEIQPGSLDDIKKAGIRETLPIHQVSKIFYADTGKILNIGSGGETNNPVLLLRRDVNAAAPRRMLDSDYQDENWYENSQEARQMSRASNEDHDDEDSELQAQFVRESLLNQSPSPQTLESHDPWALPPGLDPEWLAFEVFTDDPDSDDGSDSGNDEADLASRSTSSELYREASLGPSLATAMSRLHIHSARSATSLPKYRQSHLRPNTAHLLHTPAAPLNLATLGEIRTSLSLLEMMIRLTSLQQFQQSSHLAITDELLNFFLEESSTTGAAPGDIEARKRIRLQARQRVGFDPYDESPIKRRGELYQHRQGQSESGEAGDDWGDDDDVRSSIEDPLVPLNVRRDGIQFLPSQLLTPDRKIAHSSPISQHGLPPFPGSRQTRSLVSSPLRAGSTRSREAFLRDETLNYIRRSSSSARGSSEVSQSMSPSRTTTTSTAPGTRKDQLNET